MTRASTRRAVAFVIARVLFIVKTNSSTSQCSSSELVCCCARLAGTRQNQKSVFSVHNCRRQDAAVRAAARQFWPVQETCASSGSSYPSATPVAQNHVHVVSRSDVAVLIVEICETASQSGPKGACVRSEEAADLIVEIREASSLIVEIRETKSKIGAPSAAGRQKHIFAIRQLRSGRI